MTVCGISNGLTLERLCFVWNLFVIDTYPNKAGKTFCRSHFRWLRIYGVHREACTRCQHNAIAPFAMIYLKIKASALWPKDGVHKFHFSKTRRYTHRKHAVSARDATHGLVNKDMDALEGLTATTGDKLKIDPT
jgi:hypothetical protein